MLIDRSIERVRAYRAAENLTKESFARAAGMGESVLRRLEKPDWNPTSNTLRRLEAIIPADFQV